MNGDRQDDVARVRELHDLERRLGQSISDLTSNLNKLHLELNNTQLAIRKYNGLIEEIEKTKDLTYKTKKVVDEICYSQEFIGKVREGIAWGLASVSTLLLIAERLGVF